VREAFRALEESGLVRLEKNRGVFVARSSLAEANEIYEVRAALDNGRADGCPGRNGEHIRSCARSSSAWIARRQRIRARVLAPQSRAS